MGSRSIDDEERRDPLDEWRALRPDQRGAVYDVLAQAATLVRTDLLRRTTVIGACPDLEATYIDIGEAIGCAVRALRSVGAESGAAESVADGRIAESRLIVAIDAMLPGAALQSARWLRGDDPCVLSRNVRSALADLIDPEGE